MVEKPFKLEIVFKDSLLLSHLYVEINSYLDLLNSQIAAYDFITDHKSEYMRFAQSMGYQNSEIPFADKDNCYIFFKLLYSRIWDAFLLYLKETILIVEIEKNDFSKNKSKAIDKYKFDKIKSELDRFNFIMTTDPEWDQIKLIKKLRDNITHQSKLNDLMKAMKFEDHSIITKEDRIIPEDISDASKYLLDFATKIDRNLTKKYDTVSVFLKSRENIKITLSNQNRE